MKFLDEAKVYIQSGAGGNGCVVVPAREIHRVWRAVRRRRRQRRRRHVEAVDGLNTLIDYRFQQHFKAQRGENGMGKDRHGANGKDIVLQVPVGTEVYEEDGETLIADLTELGRAVMLAEGGNGGFGNAALQVVDQSRAAQRQSRPARR